MLLTLSNIKCSVKTGEEKWKHVLEVRDPLCEFLCDYPNATRKRKLIVKFSWFFKKVSSKYHGFTCLSPSPHSHPPTLPPRTHTKPTTWVLKNKIRGEDHAVMVFSWQAVSYIGLKATCPWLLSVATSSSCSEGLA